MTQPPPPQQQQQHPGYRPGAVPPPPPRPQPAKAPYGEDIDEAGGLGDEVDSISLRDVASVRYVRYHEWMELVLGSAVDTRRIVPPKVIPAETKDWTFHDKDSLERRLKEVQAEVQELENTNNSDSNQTSSSLSQFYNDGIAQLREHFGSRKSSVEQTLTQQLENTFPGHSVVEKTRARRVGTDLGLPEPKEQPEAVTRHLEQQKREQEEREQREQEEKQRKEQEEEQQRQQDQQQQDHHNNGSSLQLHHNGMDLGQDPMDTAPDMMNMLDHDVQMNDAELGELLNMPHGDQ